MKTIQFFVILGMMIGFTVMSFGQNSDNTNAPANASIIKPIHLAWDQDLVFGQITPSVLDGIATIGVTAISVPNAGYIHEDPVTINCASVNNQPTAYYGDKNPGPAVFTVSGELNYTFGISLPPATQTIPVHLVNNTTNAPDIVLDNFESTVGNPGIIGSTGILSLGTGFQFFAVGGTLNIPHDAAPGFYQGSFIVTVYYN